MFRVRPSKKSQGTSVLIRTDNIAVRKKNPSAVVFLLEGLPTTQASHMETGVSLPEGKTAEAAS